MRRLTWLGAGAIVLLLAPRADTAVQSGAGVVAGRVVDQAGAPLAGVSVGVTRTWSALDPPVAETRTAADGTYRLPDLPTGLYLVSSASPVDSSDRAERFVIVWPDRTATADLQLAADGQTERDDDWYRRRFHLGLARAALERWLDRHPTDYDLVVEHECACPELSTPRTVTELFDFAVSAVQQRPDGFAGIYDPHTGLPTFLHVDPDEAVTDDETTLWVTRFSLPSPVRPPGTLDGRIVEPGGSGVANAAITLVRGDMALTAASDADGRFRIQGLAPGAYRLSATREGYQATEADSLVVVTREWTPAREFTMVPDHFLRSDTQAVAPGSDDAGTVSGRAVDCSGSAIPGVTVTLTGRQGRRRAVTDVNGEYRIAGVAPGEYSLIAELAGFETFLGADRTAERVISMPGDQSRVVAGFVMLVRLAGPRGREEDRLRRIDQLDAMIRRWTVARPASYVLELSPSEGLPAAAFRVNGDVATVGARRADVFETVKKFVNYYDTYQHVHQLFEAAAREIDRRPGRFEVQYDATYGVPLLIRTGVAGVRDDRLHVRVSAFRPLESGESR